MTVGVMAVVAQYEAEAISARTKAALAAARARGTVLGGLRPNAPDVVQFYKQANQTVSTKARKDAELRRDVIEALLEEHLSMNTIAARLNTANVRTSRRGRWTAKAVKRTMTGLGIQEVVVA